MLNSYLSCLRRYGLFKGRTNALVFREFLLCYLILLITAFILWQIWDQGEFDVGNPLYVQAWKKHKLLYGGGIFLLLHIPALFSSSYRRLSDAGYKKNAFLLLFIPVLGWISLLHLLLQPTRHRIRAQESKSAESTQADGLESGTQGTRKESIKEIYAQELGDFSQTTSDVGGEFYRATPSAEGHAENPRANLAPVSSPPSAVSQEPELETQYKVSVLWSDFYLNSIEKYASFKGKARRGEYFSFIFFLLLFLPILVFLDGLLGLNFTASSDFSFLNLPISAQNDYNDLSLQQTIYDFYAGKMLIGYLSVAYLLLSISPLLALQVRRINDTGKNGLQYLWYIFLPILGWFILLILSMQKSRSPQP